MTKKTFGLLLTISLVGFFLRFFLAGHYPPLLWDEASLGYNAYSILKTGKDEYGQILPLVFKSFGDYKPGVYVYLTLPFVAIFGLTPLSVRLPSILLGTFTPFVFYLLVKKISPKHHALALLGAALISINPYNIYFSRTAWETNILTFELLLASLFFLSNRHLLSAAIFGLSLYTYQAGKMISLFLIIILFILRFAQKNYSLPFKKFCFPLALFTIPLLYGLFFNNSGNRLAVISLFSYPRSQQESNQILLESSPQNYALFHNQIIFFTRNFLGRYFNHFSPRFLAFEGDWQNARHSAPYSGLLLYPSLFFLIIGLFVSPYSFKKPLHLFFLLWLLSAPLPSALTRDSVQAVRSMSFSIPLIFFTSQGLSSIISLFKKSLLRLSFIFLTFLTYILSLVYWGDLYLNHMVKINPVEWLYGYEQAAKYLILNEKNFHNIYFTDYYGQPYIYYLFYSQYPPSKYQQQASLNTVGLDTGKIEAIDRIKFTPPPFNAVKNQPSTLLLYSYEELIRQGIVNSPDFSSFKALSPLNNHSNFYVFQNP